MTAAPEIETDLDRAHALMGDSDNLRLRFYELLADTDLSTSGVTKASKLRSEFRSTRTILCVPIVPLTEIVDAALG